MVVINGLTLPSQTLFSAEHNGRAGFTDVSNTLSGKAVVFSKTKQNRHAQLIFDESMAWLTKAQRDALISMTAQISILDLTVRSASYQAVFDFSAGDGAVVLSPVFNFCDRYFGAVNLIIVE